MINLHCVLKELRKNARIFNKNGQRERTHETERGGKKTGDQATIAIFA